MAFLKRLVRALPLLLISPFCMAASFVALVAAQVFGGARRSSPAKSVGPSCRGASVVIPNWNGRDLLEKYLPGVVAALAGNPHNEIVVVDDGSSDGSAGDDWAKIGALGLKVRNGCTYHGVALNVDMDLEPFAAINPCGYPGLAVTQLRDLGVMTSFAGIGEQLGDALRRMRVWNICTSDQGAVVDACGDGHDRTCVRYGFHAPRALNPRRSAVQP
jgi:hypothetical protein